MLVVVTLKLAWCGAVMPATLVVGIANSRKKKVFVYAWIVCSRFVFTKSVVLGSIIRCLSIDDSAQLLYPKP
jgi:hypothetical protein